MSRPPVWRPAIEKRRTTALVRHWHPIISHPSRTQLANTTRLAFLTTKKHPSYSSQPLPHLLRSPASEFQSARTFENHRPLSPPSFDSYAASNAQAAHANAPASIEPRGFVDPDDYYRSYDPESMASTMPASRQHRDASLRSNGNVSNPKPPAIPPTRPGLRPTLRSVSAPIDDKGASSSRPAGSSSLANRSAQKPSVKDLKKRFDQTSAQSSSGAPRKAATRLPTRDKSASPAGRRGTGSSGASNGQTPYGALRSSVTRDLPGSGTSTTTRSSQRSRAVAEDQVSNNSQSFASRIAKPRAPAEAPAQVSKSMTNLSSAPTSEPIPPVPQSRAMLFGEIGPGEIDTGLAGFGIEGHETRSTSESDLNDQAGPRQRSLSHADAKPPSPSDWYRDRTDEPTVRDGTDSKKRSSTKSHSRSRSDNAGTKPILPRLKTPQAQQTKPPASSSTMSSSSKLPLSIRKLGTPSNSTSPSSTRSNSPSSRRRNPAGKASKIPPTSRAKTPTSNGNATTHRPNRAGAVTPSNSNNTRLNAYISTPPPKLSPPLRSSRPRQPVSAATTNSSRMKAVERGGSSSPSKHELRPHSRADDPNTRRRKISMGPIDFASRREQIKLSYTKSIRESEARSSAKKIADDRRKKAEAEAAAEERKKQAEAEAAKAQLAAAEALERREEQVPKDSAANPASPAETEVSPAESLRLRTITSGFMMESPADIEVPSAEQPPLPGMNSGPGITPNQRPPPQVSPTLGIPGSFPGMEIPVDQEEAPPSAISNSTEFDADPQTEPPKQELPTRESGNAPNAIESNVHFTHRKSEYRSPFDDDDESPIDDSASIKISLDETIGRSPDVVQQPTVTDVHRATPEVPRPHEAVEYEPTKHVASEPYQTKVTILRRDSDFIPSARKPSESSSMIPPSQEYASRDHAARLGEPESCHDKSWGGGYAPNEEVTPSSAGLSEMEEFFVGPKLKDHSAHPANRQGADSREGVDIPAQHTNEEPRFSVDSRRTMATRPSLTVPRTSESMNRISQATAWTDYSINSQDRYSGYASKEEDFPNRDSAYHEEHTTSEFESRPQFYRYDRGSGEVSSSSDVSPHGTYRGPELPYGRQNQLPEIDAGASFDVKYAGHQPSPSLASVPVRPEHTPPPPPSEYFDETRRSSFARVGGDDRSLFSLDPSTRESEDYLISRSATRSIDQGSLEISESQQSGSSRLASQQTLSETLVDQASDVQGLPPKERKRLFTRLETIKELIDTEAFFIRDMNIVEEIYKGTAEACPKLDDKTIKLIFRNSDQIIKFHATFLAELKEGVCSVYVPKAQRSQLQKDTSSLHDGNSPSTATGHLSDEKDRETSLGPIFIRNMENMKLAHEAFLKNSDHAAKRLIQIQEDPTVQVWLNECNEVARELTKAWDLDSLLIKPMQRITKYPNLIIQLLHETPTDHPDRPALESAKASLLDAIEDINRTKKNFELVGQIVGRKRKESDVKAGFARAFGKRVDKLQAGTNRPPEDAEYVKLHEKFGDDYLRLQVVLRDVEFYTRQVTEYVHEFLQYLSSMELVMRLQPSPHPEIESKWVRFNVGMRDIEKVALDQHLQQVRKQVIEPFELVIKSYGNPSLAMKKRAKRRLDYEKSIQLKKSGKKIDKQLSEFIEQYEALNDALKTELPKLSALTEKVGNICLGNFVNIQREYRLQEEQIGMIGIVNPASRSRPSLSASTDESFAKLRPRPADLSSRHRGMSSNSEMIPSLPTPDFIKRNSGQFNASPTSAPMSNPQHYYRDYYSGIGGFSGAPNTPELSASTRSLAAPSIRPGTGQSYESGGMPRQSMESKLHARRYSNSNSTHASTHASPYQLPDNQRYSGLFQSALPLSDHQERQPRQSQASSRASSRERQPINGYNVLWLAASLFEFNIETTKTEAGYPYLTYQAGEIFDVIAEKGELWLAKNQDDPNNLVGWLWSKHFARLADD
ncbi:hypothetical protein F4780DRAFT_188510 [Xylariomycetidae sp. FL0641]|nr:hypothetical protein F4780DRAFT_188510 [Xylariomycetidae sp. FL0641]